MSLSPVTQLFRYSCGLSSTLGLTTLLALSGMQPASGNEAGEPVTETVNAAAELPPSPHHPQPATTVTEWLAQMEAALVQITNVRVESTETGLQVVLETVDGDLSVPTPETVGNALVAEIPNAVLALPEGDEFQQTNPAEGIARVSVTAVGQDRIQVAITGTDAPPEATVSAEAGNLVWTVVPGVAQVGDADDAIQIVVTGEQEGYYVPEASTATRTDTPIRDVPQSIQVIPQQVIEDQQNTTLEEVLRNAASVTSGNNDANVSSTQTVSIRGFPQFSLFRNGFPTGATAPIDVAGVEQVEILRGPASVLFGQVEPGGIVNVITKRPLSEPYYSFEGQIGSYGFYRPTLDISGPLTEDGNLLYRLNAAYTNTNSFRDFVERESIYVAPVISYEFSDRTRITVDLEYTNDDRTLDRGLPIIGDRPGELPRSRFLQETGDFRRIEDIFTGYEFEHEFSENWRLRNQFRYHFREFNVEEISGGRVANDNRTLNRRFQRQDNRLNEFNLITDVTGNFSTGSIDHTLLLGLDLRWTTENWTGQFGSADPIDIFNPVYGAQIPDNLTDFTIEGETNWVGIYIQDQISLLDNLILLLGGRLDFANSSLFTIGFGDLDNEVNDTAFSPRVGIVYRPVEPVSLYASYSESFSPLSGFSAGLTFEGEPFQPETGQQFEIGAKAEFFDGRLAATLALYNLTKQNITTADPDNPGFQIQTGEQRSRGIELDVTGEIVPGLNLIASYAYTDARITRDNTPSRVGLRPTNTPEHAGSLWLTYEFQQGSLEGLGLGAGVFAASRIDGSDGTFFLPGYATIDLATWYNFSAGDSDIRLQLNVKNLFDADYYSATSSRGRNRPGDPLTVIGSVSVTF